MSPIIAHWLPTPTLCMTNESKVWAMDFEQEYLESKANPLVRGTSPGDHSEKVKKRLTANFILFSGRLQRGHAGPKALDSRQHH
ncbi:hypothetical protein RYA05_01320 [Pseudomonas syringae pv. actinidiae]|nr:hypothetical protein [Pseudomonas syringae pv. actinidiae]